MDKNNNDPFGAIEYTTFKLVGVTLAQFITANEEIDQFLKKQPGFSARHIAQLDNGTIVDLLLWDSRVNGTNAMHKLMNEMSDSIVHRMIDHQTVSWNIASIQHQL